MGAPPRRSPPRRFGCTVGPLTSERCQLLVRHPMTGKQVGMGSFADKEQAEQEGRGHVVEQQRGLWHDPRIGQLSLANYLADWLENKRRTRQHGNRYAVEAERLVRLHIKPIIGHHALADIR